MTDYFGQQLAEGQAIIHGSVRGSCIRLRRGYVVRTDGTPAHPDRLRIQLEGTSKESLVACYNVVIVG